MSTEYLKSETNSLAAKNFSEPEKVLSDPFALDSLKISQNFGESLGVKKLLTSVPVRKPDRQWWIQVHPEIETRLETAILTIKEDNETYIVAKGLREQLANEIKPHILLLAINRNNNPFLWPIQLPDSDGKHNEWHRSALDIALNYATKGWSRIESDKNLGAYRVATSTAPFSPPTWPEMSFQEIVKVAFRDRFIQDADHPIVKRLRGLA
jgi:hypothetical protein